MHSGLPSLLDAIFGKKDLASVSLDEMYEVINEFPSFNAAHFLLSKKLKQQNGEVYEKENMRTALYFNNAFWLQTLLEDENHIRREEIIPAAGKSEDEEVYLHKPIGTEFSPPAADELDLEEEEILDEKNDVEQLPAKPEFTYREPGPDTVSSFDELLSKYKIDVDETHDTPAIEIIQEEIQANIEDTVIEFQTEPVPDAIPELAADHSEAEAPFSETFETREEILNEYGIFEDEIVKASDHDREAFDRPLDKTEETPEVISIEIPELETESILENKIPEQTTEKPFDRDHEAFDRPIVNSEPEKPFEIFAEQVNGYDAQTVDADNTETLEVGENQLPDLINRIDPEQPALTPFDAKQAEAIVFAPYHMIDYFASQGIKLVLEDQPVDSFGKQLKSFTDWLKVMKKLPVQPLSEKADEKEVDRIRHFAAHSIEERDILTESMAEVLAKQGMYENAIALYQKLSLIYPPKSAYFASRIEQLKASLP